MLITADAPNRQKPMIFLTVTSTIQAGRLLGDIGSTNVRFGWQAQVGGEIAHILCCLVPTMRVWSRRLRLT